MAHVLKSGNEMSKYVQENNGVAEKVSIGSSIMALMRDMSCIQQAINRIREIGRAVDLSAINAGLAARGIGSAGLGFSVAAQELRVFSKRLNTQTGVLSSNIGQVVNVTAHMMMETRQEMLLRQAQRLSGNAAMAQRAEIQGRRLEVEQGKLDRHLDVLENALHVVHLMGVQGLGFTRAARVEAAYAALHRRRLTAVADDLEGCVAEILALNKSASRQLGVWR